MWNETKMQKLGEGVIFLVHSYEAIKFKELGDSHLGIILEKSLQSLPNALCHYLDFPHLSLIPWPINQLTFESGESLKSTNTIVHAATSDKEVIDELLLQQDSDSSCHQVDHINEVDSSSSDDELQSTVNQGC